MPTIKAPADFSLSTRKAFPLSGWVWKSFSAKTPAAKRCAEWRQSQDSDELLENDFGKIAAKILLDETEELKE